MSRTKIHHTPLGIDTARFVTLGQNTAGRICCVCDCREPRKRIDLLLAAFERATQIRGNLTLTLAGRGSDYVRIPPSLEGSVERWGFVSNERITALYQTSNLMVLLSDYEAFGLPIAEALSCGAQVLLNRHPVLEELFQGMPGVNWTTNTDVGQTAAKLVECGFSHVPSSEISSAAAERFGWNRTYALKFKVLQTLLKDGGTSSTGVRP